MEIINLMEYGEYINAASIVSIKVHTTKKSTTIDLLLTSGAKRTITKEYLYNFVYQLNELSGVEILSLDDLDPVDDEEDD